MDLFLNNEECTVSTKKFGAHRAQKNKSLGNLCIIPECLCPRLRLISNREGNCL